MIAIIVVITNNKFVLKPKFDEANTLGIIKKITKLKIRKKEVLKIYSFNDLYNFSIV